MKKDLTGNHFGHLTVLNYNPDTKKWVCQCDCGNITEVFGYNLTLGNTKSCGCSQNAIGIKRPRPLNIMNEQIGQLLVTDVNSTTNIATVKCLQCKRIVKMPIDKLVEMKRTRKKSYTCGLDGCEYSKGKPSAKSIKPNTRFGKLVVIERLPNKIIVSKNSTTSLPVYRCKCDCGNEVEVQGRYLLDNRTKSCGCLKKENFNSRVKKQPTKKSETNKKLYEIYKGWEQKYKNPSKSFQENIINKNIKFFPEFNSVGKPIEAFSIWAKTHGFSIKENKIYLDRMNYSKDFNSKNCFWTDEKTRGY